MEPGYPLMAAGDDVWRFRPALLRLAISGRGQLVVLARLLVDRLIKCSPAKA